MMGSVCAEHHHHHHSHHHQHHSQKYHPLMSPKKNLQDLNIPPRKLLSRRSTLSPDHSDYFPVDSPSKLLQAEALLQKFLPYNGDSSSASSDRDDGLFDPDADPYSSDQFRMYEFKVRKCTRSRSHDWTDCPFSHPGEKARRRDPRRFHYSGTVCPEYRRSGSCSRGDECEYAHGVFECWLHPARYRTEACKDGKNCKRKVCFFAHSPRELRVLPAQDDDDIRDSSCGGASSKSANRNTHPQHCCRYCCSALSPTSTLLGRSHFSPPMSPSGLSPPRSPMKAVGLSGFSPVSLYSDRISACGSVSESLGSKGMSYEDMMIAELLGSLDGMSISEAAAALKSGAGGPNRGPGNGGGLWVDVGYDNVDDQQQQLQFNMSPSTPINPPALSRSYYSTANSNSFNTSTAIVDEKVNETGLPGPDLGWVNDLLM